MLASHIGSTELHNVPQGMDMCQEGIYCMCHACYRSIGMRVVDIITFFQCPCAIVWPSDAQPQALHSAVHFY